MKKPHHIFVLDEGDARFLAQYKKQCEKEIAEKNFPSWRKKHLRNKLKNTERQYAFFL
jgi:hypothetical protein